MWSGHVLYSLERASCFVCVTASWFRLNLMLEVHNKRLFVWATYEEPRVSRGTLPTRLIRAAVACEEPEARAD